jgi:hypothetical protein
MGRHHTAFNPFWQSQSVGFPNGANSIYKCNKAGPTSLEINILWPRGSFTNPTTVPRGFYKIDVRLEN